MDAEIIDSEVVARETISQATPDEVRFRLGCPFCGQREVYRPAELARMGAFVICPHCRREGHLPTALSVILEPLRDAIAQGRWVAYMRSLGPQYGWLEQMLQIAPASEGETHDAHQDPQ